MLDFPNGGDLQPQPWVPREIATYASFNLKPAKIFVALEPLVDAMYGESGGFFKDIIDSIEEEMCIRDRRQAQPQTGHA